MPQEKKIIINSPEPQSCEVDAFDSEDKMSCRTIKQAVAGYAKIRKKQQLIKQMKKGYREMGDINSHLAEICFDADCLQVAGYEKKLAESD